MSAGVAGRLTAEHSVNDVRGAFRIEPGNALLHCLQLPGRMADPVLDLADDAQQLAGAVGQAQHRADKKALEKEPVT